MVRHSTNAETSNSSWIYRSKMIRWKRSRRSKNCKSTSSMILVLPRCNRISWRSASSNWKRRKLPRTGTSANKKCSTCLNSSNVPRTAKSSPTKNLKLWNQGSQSLESFRQSLLKIWGSLCSEVKTSTTTNWWSSRELLAAKTRMLTWTSCLENVSLWMKTLPTSETTSPNKSRTTKLSATLILILRSI